MQVTLSIHLTNNPPLQPVRSIYSLIAPYQPILSIPPSIHPLIAPYQPTIPSRFFQVLCRYVDTFNSCHFYMWVSNRWLNFRYILSDIPTFKPPPTLKPPSITPLLHPLLTLLPPLTPPPLNPLSTPPSDCNSQARWWQEDPPFSSYTHQIKSGLPSQASLWCTRCISHRILPFSPEHIGAMSMSVNDASHLPATNPNIPQPTVTYSTIYHC